MSSYSLALSLLVLSVLIPAVTLAVARAFGVPMNRLSGVMLGFWLPSLTSTIAALYYTDHLVLMVNITLYAIIIVPRLLMPVPKLPPVENDAYYSDDITGPVERGGPIEIVDQPIACVPVLTGQGGGRVPFTRSGRSGNVGWYFALANYYVWRVDLNITANNDGVIGTAVATGRFSGWNEFSFTARNANAEATGSIKCLKGDSNTCRAVANGGQFPNTDVDYSAAVIVRSMATGATANFEVEVATAIAGQVAISAINLGGQVKGVKVGTTINLPVTANDKAKIVRSYSYQCNAVQMPDG